MYSQIWFKETKVIEDGGQVRDALGSWNVNSALSYELEFLVLLLHDCIIFQEGVKEIWRQQWKPLPPGSMEHSERIIFQPQWQREKLAEEEALPLWSKSEEAAGCQQLSWCGVGTLIVGADSYSAASGDGVFSKWTKSQDYLGRASFPQVPHRKGSVLLGFPALVPNTWLINLQ